MFCSCASRLFDWRPEKLRGERPKSDCTVVLKNVFTFKEFLVTQCNKEIVV